MDPAVSLQAPNDQATSQPRSLNIENAMIEACESGNVSQLQQLLSACSVKPGSPPIEPKHGDGFPPPSTPPPTWKLLTAAITQSQSAILTLLFKTYPTVTITRQSILSGALSNPHLETFKLLYEHDPSIVNYEFDASNSSILMEACRGGNPLLPHFLLDNGADANEGGFPGAGPLFYAVNLGQPLEVVTKMIEKGARITDAALSAAENKGRTDVLGFLRERDQSRRT